MLVAVTGGVVGSGAPILFAVGPATGHRSD